MIIAGLVGYAAGSRGGCGLAGAFIGSGGVGGFSLLGASVIWLSRSLNQRDKKIQVIQNLHINY